MSMAGLFAMRRLAFCLAGAGLMSVATHAGAIGLIEAYDAALANDPVYRSAVHDNEAGRENRALGLSNLLPSASITYNGSKNWADQTIIGQGETRPVYISSTGGLQVRQPLYAPDGVARYHEGNAQADVADAVLSSKQQDLITRLVGAYVDALFADDALRLSIAQRDTFLEQMQANDRMFKEGEGTKTDMLETQAKLDLAEAQVIEARDARSVNLQTFEAIVGREVEALDGLNDNFQAPVPQPAGIEEWKTMARERNPDLAAQRYSVEVARQEVLRNRAGHLPRVDFVASATKDKADTIDTYTTDSTVRSAGVQVTIPLYAGGSVSALTRQASAAYEKAKSDLDDKTNQVMIDLRKQHYTLLSSVPKIDALVKSVNSAKLLVTATTQSIRGGERVNLDLLNAEQQLYTAQRDLAQARYSCLVAYLKLRADAGVLTVDDLRNIAGYFTATR
jgi:protease secretion system outer membrane protein